MREIKFRAWDWKSKAMFPVHKLEWHKISDELIHLSGVDIHHKDSDYEGDVAYGGHPDKMTGMPGKPQIKRFELMQYTGFKDQAGIEIYEGDIVTWFVNDNLFTAPVYFDTDQASFWMGEDINKRCGLVLNDWMRGGYEVIGNIYKNLELLGNGK